MIQSRIHITKHKELILEPELRKKYLPKLQKIRNGKYYKFNSIEELRNMTI